MSFSTLTAVDSALAPAFVQQLVVAAVHLCWLTAGMTGAPACDKEGSRVLCRANACRANSTAGCIFSVSLPHVLDRCLDRFCFPAAAM